MSSLSVTPTSDVETCELVGDLAEELDDFALQRERVLAKLDIRAARLARRIARELRVVLRGLAVATGSEAHAAVHETLGGLLEEAHRLLDGAHPAASAPSVAPTAPASVPPSSASTTEDMSSHADAPGEDEAPLRSGTRPIDDDDAFARHTMPDLGGLPRVSHDPDDPEESPEDLTIARRVMWERSGNRILGR